MHWSTTIENPQSLALLEAEPSDLAEIELHELILHRDGPVLPLRFDIPIKPPLMPARWPAESNATQIVLAVWGADALTIEGWGSTVRGMLSIEVGEGAQVIRFAGEGCSLQANYLSLRVEKIHGYVNQADG